MKLLLKILAAGTLLGFDRPVAAQEWTLTSAPLTNWQSIACSADGTRLIAAAGAFFSPPIGPVYLSTNAGATWIPISPGVTNCLHVASSADGSRLVAAGRNINYSWDSGATWSNSDAPFPNEFWSSLA